MFLSLENYDRNLSKCRGLLLHCLWYFSRFQVWQGKSSAQFTLATNKESHGLNKKSQPDPLIKAVIKSCYKNCLFHSTITIVSTSLEIPETIQAVMIHKCFAEMTMSTTSSQVPHSTTIHTSVIENKAMKEYILDALQQGNIRPSTFIFIQTMGEGLHPCKDYGGLT